jgi:hypothetical protein
VDYVNPVQSSVLKDTLTKDVKGHARVLGLTVGYGSAVRLERKSHPATGGAGGAFFQSRYDEVAVPVIWLPSRPLGFHLRSVFGNFTRIPTAIRAAAVPRYRHVSRLGTSGHSGNKSEDKIDVSSMQNPTECFIAFINLLQQRFVSSLSVNCRWFPVGYWSRIGGLWVAVMSKETRVAARTVGKSVGNTAEWLERVKICIGCRWR